MHVEPQSEHAWLQKLIGEWKGEGDANAAPDQPPVKWESDEVVRRIGDVWVTCEGKGDMPDGGCANTVMTLGYDPQKKKFIGTFIGSMMTHLWIYEGTLDDSGQKLVLDAEGPHMGAEGKMAKYQDTIEFKDDDHRLLRSQMQMEDGSWQEFMVVNYRRKK